MISTMKGGGKKKVLYLPSTPLNVLVAVAHASAFSDEQISQIVLIDQKNRETNAYFKALKPWEGGLFKRVELTLGVAQGWQKIGERKKNFTMLASLFNQFKPDAIAVGSDRRVEFQYLMQLGQLSSTVVEGWYMDDGLYSYAGRKSHWLKDSVNAALKKIVYGRWWQEPRLVGSSDWIQQAWLFQPEQSISALNHKTKRALPATWFTSSDVQALSRAIFCEFGLADKALEQLQKTDVVLLIPHPNNIKKMYGYSERITHFVEKLKEKGKTVAVKYHPRTEGLDPLFLRKNEQFWVVPSHLAFEFVLPSLPSKALVIGDVGTALLTTKWLRSDVQGVAVLPEHNPFESDFRTLFSSLGVTIVSDFNAVLDAYFYD